MAKKNSKRTNPHNKWLFIAGAFVTLFVIFYPALPKQTITPTQTTTSTSNPATANWKTYSNLKYGLSIKYPPDWDFNGTEKESYTLIDVTYPSVIFSIKQPGARGVNINLIKNLQGDFCTGSKTSSKQISLGRITGKEYICDGIPHVIIYRVNNDVFYLMGGYPSSQNAEYQEKIFQSFKLN